MPHVLIATDEPNFTMGLVEGYRSLGWEITLGTLNFRIKAARYDVVHFMWPEEFSGWKLPKAEDILEIRRHLEWWHLHSYVVFTVNNLYPHQFERHPLFHELYATFYSNSHLITHFTDASRRLVLEEFHSAKERRHVVHFPANYEVTLATQQARGSRRSQFGIGEDEYVILVLGSLRSWDEVELVQRAFDLTRIPRKRLLMAGKLKAGGPVWRSRFRKMVFRWWLMRCHAVVDTRYVPENEISQFIESCDVAIVPRLSGLNSAIIFLAMTFGRMVIVPNLPGYMDCVAGTRNPVYEVGSAESLAVALQTGSRLDYRAVGCENAKIAAKWTWKRMVQDCLAQGFEKGRSRGSS